MYILYPGMYHTEATISQHYYWKIIRENFGPKLKFAKIVIKTRREKNGHLPTKEAEAIPWYRLLLDIIGSYKIRR